MPQFLVERASSANYGRYSDLIVNSMEDATTRSSLPNIFSKSVSDEHRAQALYQVFIEIASEIETTSQFKNVMAQPVTVAVTVPCPIAHNDPCTREHIPTPKSLLAPLPPLPIDPKKVLSSLPLPLAPPPPQTSSIDKMNKRKHFKNKKRKHVKIESDHEANVNTMVARYGSEPEMDSDGFFADPIYGLKDDLNDYMKEDVEPPFNQQREDRETRLIEHELRAYKNLVLLGFPADYDPTLLGFSPDPSPQASPSLPPGLFRIPSPTLPPKVTLPKALPTPSLLPTPKIALPRAQTEP
ncbi:hypothetical protein M378DRAFT_12069 [Amanita muscaria Koide BX008]|uniref:Uncharacterized protein n=1 Tax=Amanita muscaria (strain Koide BX008) TaxID=946122 RepID=A0A0C2WPR6_AMAMK|nr:hypothetical protein M378DRAFT_12069 [Amanita muscaria Koide BX008]